MASSTTQIVHKLNELIAEAETESLTLIQDRPAHESLEITNHYKRAIGQLKAARVSFIATGLMGRAA